MCRNVLQRTDRNESQEGNMFYFTLGDIFLAWGILAFLIFCLLIWPCCVVAGRADEASGCK